MTKLSTFDDLFIRNEKVFVKVSIGTSAGKGNKVPIALKVSLKQLSF